jgi:hypothetical protein
MAYIKNITFPWTINLIIPWKNLWYCNSLTLSLNPSKGFIYQGNSVTSTVTATFPSDSASPVTLSCPNLPANVRCSFSENPITPSTSGTNSILTIYTDSATITGNYNIIVNASNNDVTGKAIYNLTVGANGDQICQPELGENCKTSIDCFCSINELCCSDGTCGTQGSCQSTCNNNGECELGEGCSCSDCYSSQQKDSCGDDLVCDSATETCQCPSDKSYWCANENQCSEDQDCKCGNGVADTGENCFNCPDDAGCLTETLCYKENNNYVCGSNPPGQCDNNGICDRNSTYYETCDCSDCTNSQDRCLSGLICKSNERCGCKPFISDGICPNDPACETIDPDCVCPNPNNLCEVGENQINCPQDCNTVVSVYPQRMYPGSKVNVTVYFNDSRFYIGRDVKLALYIDDVPWTTCEIDNKKWTDMGWSRGENWETTLNSIRIVSKNTFAQINFECLVPSDIDQGTHTLKAVPYMYSKETPLNNGQTEILVQENCLENKFIKFLIFYFISISLIL